MDSGNCNIKNRYATITNTGFFTLGTHNNPSIIVDGTSTIDNFINYGQIETYISLSGTINHLTNYGTMQGISVPYNNHQNHIVTIENYGTINYMNNDKKYHFNKVTLRLQAYAMRISLDSAKFNAFDGNLEDNSHLVLKESQGVSFADKNSKIILDFGKNFEFGAGYKLDKLIVKANDGANALNVDFDRLMPKSDIYTLYKQGDYFIARLQPQHSAISSISKSNIRTINNFMTMSNSMIYPRKYYKSQNLGRKNSSLQHSPSLARGNFTDSPSLAEGARGWVEYPSLLDSTLYLKSYESFAYQNESQNLQNRRIQRQNKRNYSRSVKDSSLRADSQNLRGNLQINKEQNYYFILTPFINHNYFFESGRYNLSGFDGGFLTAFSAKVAESNSLGAHFMMSYGTLGDSSDKNFHISNLNLNLGLNYKLDLAWDMYLKARGDVFYFLNQVKTLTMEKAIKPNNLGFGLSVSYGKDFDFKQGGVFGIEAGIDYKALSANEITLDSMNETYKKSLYHLLYLDLGLTYAKYFDNFGLNATLGIKGNITANKLAKSQISLNNFNRSVDMILDNDKILGYANVGLSYVLNARKFDMEFSLAYYGNFGDRVISNGGGVEWRVTW